MEWPIDLGGGVRAEWSEDALWINHPKTGPIRVPASEKGQAIPPIWQIVQRDPISLTPSIKVGKDDAILLHGFVTNGKWVDS